MEGKLGLSSQGRKSSWFVSGMGVPGGMVVEPDGLAGAQGRDTVAWEGFKSDWNDQLCGLSSPFSPPGCAGEVEVSLPQGCNGGGTARDTDSAGDRHARNVGTVQGDPMLMARLEALESQLAQVTQLLIGLSGSMVGSCSQGLSPSEDNSSIRNIAVRGDAISHSSNTGVTATVTRSVASVPCYTSVTPVSMGVVLSQGTLFGQSQVNHALVSQAGIHSGQSKGALSCGEPLYSDRGPSILKVSEASLPQMGSSHEGRDSPGTQGHSSLLAGQGYGRSHSSSGVAPDGNLGAGMTQRDSDVLLVPPLARENVSHSCSRSGRNVPAEAKCLQYTGSLEWGLFYAKFRTLARYYGWNDDDCLLALSVSVEGPALKYFYILSSRGEELSFPEIASRFEQRFGKGTLQAASQVEFYSMSQGEEESLEQWGDRVMEIAQRALGAQVPGEVLQEQAVLRFAMGCNDTRVGRKLIESPSSTVDEAVHRVKTYQLSHQVFDPCRREVRMVSVGRQSQGLGCTPGGKVIPSDRGVSTSGKGKRHRWSGRCFKCRQRGNFRRECPEKCSESSAGTGVRSRHARSKVSPTVGAEKGIMSSVGSCGAVGYAEGAWQVPVKVNDVPVSAVVDTAAEITIVGQSIHDQMSPRPEIIASKDVSLAWGGETMTVGSLRDVLVEIGGTNVRHPVYVAPIQVDMLLGIDFLHENAVELDCSTGDLSVGASKVPMFKATSPSGLREDICTPGPPYGCERPA